MECQLGAHYVQPSQQHWIPPTQSEVAISASARSNWLAHRSSLFDDGKSPYNVYLTPMTTLPPRPRRMGGKWSDICLSFVVITFPMLSLNAALVIIVLRLGDLTSLDVVWSERAINVNINATIFTAFSSWASILSTLLGSSIIILGAYHSSLEMVKVLRRGDASRLPTPYQLGMIMNIRAGSTWKALLRLLMYVTTHRRKRAALARPLGFLASMLILSIVLRLVMRTQPPLAMENGDIFVILIDDFFQSALVIGSDAWLHLATREITTFHTFPSPGTNLGVALLDNCLVNNNSYLAQSNWDGQSMPGPCTLNMSNTRPLLTAGGLQGQAVLNNVSDLLITKRYTLQGSVYAYLAPADTEYNRRQDYLTSTYAASTSCAPTTIECGMLNETMTTNSSPFNCTENGFSGDIRSSPFQSRYYRDPEFRDSLFKQGFNNPFYFIVAAYLPSEWPQPNDPQVASQANGDHAAVLNCTTTIYDVRYQARNGSVILFELKQSNSSVANALSSPIAFTRIGNAALYQAFSYTGVTETAQDMANTWAAEYSRVAISHSVTALQTTPGITAEYRVPVLVSRIPIIPFIALLTTNLLYCVAAVGLALVAVMATRDPEVTEIVGRMTVQALVASKFDDDAASAPVRSVDDMFWELTVGSQHRVGVVQLENGGYAYHVNENIRE